MSVAPLVLVQRDGAVGTVTLHRPERLNAMDAAMTAELVAALAEADADEATGAIVLAGSGRAFCAGGDVNNMGVAKAVDRVLHRDWHLHQAFLSTEKPVVAMVHGPAIGLGATVALACDLVLVADDARIGDPHVPLGVVAGDGLVVPALLAMGPLRTKELLLRGGVVSGVEAAALGLVNRSVPAGELRAATYELAAELAAQPRYALRATKLVVNRFLRSAYERLVEPSLAMEMISMGLPDHPEAVRRFRERRTRAPEG